MSVSFPNNHRFILMPIQSLKNINALKLGGHISLSLALLGENTAILTAYSSVKIL